MATIGARPFGKWDLERMFYTDPLLSVTERSVAIQLLKSMDKQFRPVEINLHAQALIASRVGCWRETVCRVLRKLRVLGYFVAYWRTVQRRTLQGIKGVTRVVVELGPVVTPFVNNAKKPESPGNPRGVICRHPSQALPAREGAVSTDVVTQSTDRKGRGPSDEAEDRRAARAGWVRLAGRRPESAERLPSWTPAAFYNDPVAYRAYLDDLEAQSARKVKPPRRG